MDPFFEYLIKMSVSIAAVSLFYYAILRRLTFYTWNRFYLLIYSALCFVIPLLTIETALNGIQDGGTTELISHIPSFHQFEKSVTDVAIRQHVNASIDMMQMLFMLVATGTLIMIVRFGLHVWSYLRILKNARLVSDEDVKIFHVARQVSPFSFGKSIFYNPELHQTDELKNIILHEYIHVRQRHSLDIIWAELICIVNWYNPFAWLLRHAIRQNLEFIADQKVLENNVDLKQYQYLLLKVAGVPELRITNQFSFSSLKQRIIMMNKKKTSRFLLSVFLLSLPLILGLLLIFRRDVEEMVSPDQFDNQRSELVTPNQNARVLYISGMLFDAATNKPLANLPLKISHQEKEVVTIRTDENGFYFHKLVREVPKNPGVVKFDHTYFSNFYYSLSYEGPDYYQFIRSESFESDGSEWSGFRVTFLGREFNKGIKSDFYFLSKRDFLKTFKSGNAKKAIHDYLQNGLEKFQTEHNLKVAFRAAHPWPKDVLTKFGNGYFDRDKNLIGYENTTQIYLDGKKADYQAVNEAFKSYPYRIDQAHEYKKGNGWGVSKEIFYITFPLHKNAPPAALIKGNMEVRNASEFDLATLQSDPYFLDGFRQTYGVGSNLMPLKTEIRKVILFKGKLARYYDSKCDRIWWIETRPEKEVFERPDLASLK